MKLYIVHGVLRDYSAGMVAIKAVNIEEARTFFLSWLNSAYDESYIEELVLDFDLSIKGERYFQFALADSDTNSPGVVTQVWGGG